MFKGFLNFFKSIWQWTRRFLFAPPTKIGLGILLIIGFTGGVWFWWGLNKGLELTNKEEFCISCHTMNDNLLPELQKTVHWKNRSGVRARCPDCHVPHEFSDKIARKMQASREVLGQIIGTIGTREKFKEHRIVLAQREWKRFKANNSKECRNCHDYKDMDFSKMRVTSQVMMRRAAERNASCVDCHKGIAHQLPDIKGAHNPAFDTLMSEAASTSVKQEKDYYSVIPQKLYADQDLSKEIGSIEVSTAVKVLQVKDNAVEIAIELWRKNKGYGRVWYGHFGLNITEATLTKEVSRDEKRITILETKTDDLTGLEWQKVKTTAWIKPDTLMESVEPIWDIARNSYSQSCSVCHRQPQPEGHDANQWPGLFAGMVGFTNMDDDTAKLVLKYLQTHSSDFVKGAHDAGSPENALQQAKP
ncbi:MAG: pentaheme c-type cytochrome TorC [Gammaproteobacteria bacterium]|nr:pentaheme c-type cytochrome TorC [Gammaproteobacteria bacterium]